MTTSSDIAFIDVDLVYDGTLLLDKAGSDKARQRSAESFRRVTTSQTARNARAFMHTAWDVLDPWTLRFRNAAMEAQFTIEHAAAHRVIDAASAAFELTADVHVLALKKSSSIVLNLSSFYDRWFMYLGLATLFNRALPLLLWACTSRKVYIALRGPVIVSFRLMRCAIFVCWVALALVCNRVVPCFMARGSMLDVIIMGTCFVPFLTHMRWVHHLPLQLLSVLVTMLHVHPQYGMCSVYDGYSRNHGLVGLPDSLGACSSAPSTPLPPPLQLIIKGLFGPEAAAGAACASCLESAARDDFTPCISLPQVFVTLSRVISRIVAGLLFQAELPVPTSNACWAVSVFGVIVLTYIACCALYCVEFRHRLMFFNSMQGNASTRVTHRKELQVHVVTQQVIMFYFVVTLSWLMIVQTSP